MGASALANFTPRVREWFEQAFDAPTPAQAKAWPAIARGEHVLLSAPTGSGKTLAAFLWALDRLSDTSGAPESGTRAPDADADAAADARGAKAEGRTRARSTRVVYVSPLKALAYDIERNLRTPLRGIGADEVTVAIRTGDTPQRERAAMARKPPDILITTPESLYLILTSQAREMLSEVEAVIVDEIHAVAASKRGSHLALTLERLERQARRPVQRIGLSATQNPLEEIGRFLVGPRRQVSIVDAGRVKQLDLRIEVPVESMSEPGGAVDANADPLDPVQGSESTRNSIWPAIYPELLELVQSHNSTIVFVNNRRSAERVALRLNELAAKQQAQAEQQAGDDLIGASGASGSVGSDRTADAVTASAPGPLAPGPLAPGPLAPGPLAPLEIARAHHGSLAREERTKVEELLKAGELPCLVATSSLELGIDMGAVDLVLQIESPKSVARGLQRIGRAGHNVGDVSRGRI
ncbi:MAG TPA: DEAD/DEAH box helicase, partial [Solirubrobacteraceae bacterium]|nr:DEAD/DEAH box helicase [Solirubrobacteraceae bacterium]